MDNTFRITLTEEMWDKWFPHLPFTSGELIASICGDGELRPAFSKALEEIPRNRVKEFIADNTRS